MRIETELANKARMIAMRRNKTLGEYLSSALAPIIDRDYRKLLEEMSREEGKK